MYASSVRYVSDATSTYRTQIRSVAASIRSRNWIGTSRPGCTVRIASVLPSRRYRVAQVGRLVPIGVGALTSAGLKDTP
jgi:hypothetical protein